MSSGAWSTHDDMFRIAALREKGRTWREIAAIMDRPMSSLRCSFSRWKKGDVGKGWDKASQAAAWVRHVEEDGWTARRIADHYGTSIHRVSVALMRRGLDGEVRREWTGMEEATYG